MWIPKDKVLHLSVGAAVAVFSAAVYSALHVVFGYPLAGLPGAVAIAGVVAGATKEATDWLDNRTNPGMHVVEALDVLATAAPGLVAAVLLHWARL
jgi:hypothetical protein